MKYTRTDIKTKREWYKIVAIGDFHLGHKACDMDRIHGHIDWIKSHDCMCILLGDTIENTIPGSKGSMWEQGTTPEEQIEHAVELLTPIKDKIIGMHDGNHSYRTVRATSISPEKWIAKDVGVKYLGHQHMHVIQFNKTASITYHGFSTHGSSGGTTSTGKLGALLKLKTIAEADFYLMGHVHEKLTHATKVSTMKSNRPIDKKEIYASSGGFIKYEDSYAEMKGYGKSNTGCVVLEFNTKRKDIHASV